MRKIMVMMGASSGIGADTVGGLTHERACQRDVSMRAAPSAAIHE